MITIDPSLDSIALKCHLGYLILHIHELFLPEHAFLHSVHPLILLVLVIEFLNA